MGVEIKLAKCNPPPWARDDVQGQRAPKKQKEPKPLPDVRVGDVWQDNDKRFGYTRLLRVKEVQALTVIAVQVIRSEPVGKPKPLKRSRFKPTSTGYKLVERDGKKVS